MLRTLPLLALALCGCDFHASRDASSVTVTLPPPKDAPAPGFSTPVTAEVR